MELSHLAAGLLQSRGSGEGFRNGFSLVLARQAKVGAVPRMVGLMAVAVRLAAAALNAGDGSAAEVAQGRDPVQQFGSLLIEFGECVGHGLSLRIHTLGLCAQKKKGARLYILVAHCRAPLLGHHPLPTSRSAVGYRVTMSVPGLQHLQRLTPHSSHGDVQRHVSAFLEEALDWKLRSELRTEGGIIDCLPIGPADRPIPVFVVEYKSHGSATLQELESKSGSRQGQTAIEQLVGYMTTERITLFGILADASRLALYANPAGQASRRPILEIAFETIRTEDIRRLRARLPFSPDAEQQLDIRDDEEFVDLLASSIEALKGPLLSMLRLYRPREYDLLSQLTPTGVTVDEFADKTAASLVSKLLLIRAMECQNDRFGAILNPRVAKSFGKSEYGFIVLAHSAYELAGTKFPHVFKADIDVFDWWFPSVMTSHHRQALCASFADMNRVLFGVLERLWAFKIVVSRDLMGLAYQRLRQDTETTILGAYFTPPILTEYALDALLTYLSKPQIMLDADTILDSPSGEHPIVDMTCGSGTFLVSLASRAVAATHRAPADTAADLVSRLHGVDIDPLAVLMARSQVFAALAPHLRRAPPPRVYWQNTLTLLDPPRQQWEFFDTFESVGTAVEEAKHDTEECREHFREQAFSLVIGNPPWGRRSQIGRRMRRAGVEEREVEQRLNQLMGGRWAGWFQGRDDNLLTPFVSIASDLLRDGGVLALVLDARFIAAEWGDRTIHILEHEFDNVCILDISIERGFPHSASYPCIVLAQRRERRTRLPKDD